MLKKCRPDAKGRIALGEYAKGVSRFTIEIDKQDRIILDPNVEIPQREMWLHRNKSAKKSVNTGLEQASSGNLKSRPSYAKHSEDDID